MWTTIYGYFALRFDSDPEVCIATDSADLRVANADTGDENAVDVGARFRTCFDILFYLSLTMLTISLVISIIQAQAVRKFLAVLGFITQFSLPFCVLFLFVSRFRHSGKVCSGDYLGENDSTEGYLIQ